MIPRKLSAGSKQKSVQHTVMGAPVQLPNGVPAERVFTNNYAPDFHRQVADLRAKQKEPFGG